MHNKEPTKTFVDADANMLTCKLHADLACTHVVLTRVYGSVAVAHCAFALDHAGLIEA